MASFAIAVPNSTAYSPKVKQGKSIYVILVNALFLSKLIPPQNISMANIKSAAKRAQIAERNRLENKSYKSAVRTLTKNYLEALGKYKTDPTPENMALVNTKMSLAYSKIDRAVKRGVLHRNAGARRKSRLAIALAKVVNSLAQA